MEQLPRNGRQFSGTGLASSGLIAQRDLNAIPKEQTRPDRTTAEEAVPAVEDVFEIAPELVLDRSHQSAFKAAVYLLRRACSLPLRETTHLGGVSCCGLLRSGLQVLQYLKLTG